MRAALDEEKTLNGTIGALVQKALAGAGHEIVKVEHKSGNFQVEMTAGT